MENFEYPTIKAELPVDTGSKLFSIKFTIFDAEDGEIIAVETLDILGDDRSDIDTDAWAKSIAAEYGHDWDEEDLDYEDELMDVS